MVSLIIDAEAAWEAIVEEQRRKGNLMRWKSKDSGNYLGRFEFCGVRILYNIGVSSLRKEFKTANIKISKN